jgi:hypothetical protein
MSFGKGAVGKSWIFRVTLNSRNYPARPLNPPQGDFYGMVPSSEEQGVKVSSYKFAYNRKEPEYELYS